MAATASYTTLLKKGGDSTAFTGESLTLVSGETYQMDTTSRRFLDPSVVPTFYEDEVEIPAGDVLEVNYLFGKVTFNEEKTAVTMDGSYIPMSTVAGAKSHNLSISAATHANTAYGNDGTETHQLGLFSVSASFSRFDDISGDFKDIIRSRVPVALEIASAALTVFRGWFVPESVNSSGDVNSLEEEELSFQLSVGDDALKLFAFE